MIKWAKVSSWLGATLMLCACSQVLQSVDLKVSDTDASLQEEFAVEETTLTLSNAKAANKDPYPRRVIQSGRGLSAGPISETAALKSKFPNSERQSPYRIGVGDVLQYRAIVHNDSAFNNGDYGFPPPIKQQEYELGVGDELALTLLQEGTSQSNLNAIPSDPDGSQSLINSRSLFSPIDSSQQKTTARNTIGRVGSDGSVLMLEIGRIEAEGKTLSQLRTEVRSILIRNGLSPRFQLEIQKFASQKVFVTINAEAKIIYLTDQTVTLREILAAAGKGAATGISTNITLNRNGQSYTMRLRDVLSLTAPQIILQDGDDIASTDLIGIIGSGNDSEADAVQTVFVVSTDGSVLLPNIGKVQAAGKTLEELRTDLQKRLKTVPDVDGDFQLDVVEFKSQTALLNIAGQTDQESPLKGAVLPITGKPQLLKEALTQAGVSLDLDKVIRITLSRGVETFQFNLKDLLSNQRSQIYVQAGDQITVETLPYKANKVFVLGGISPMIVPIDPKIRETLADILFTDDGVLSSPAAKRSEVYLLRGTDPVRAYRLDAQNPTRLVVADAMELRPNDILFVAEQPIISFNRTLESITPLRILLSDIRNEVNR